MHAEQDIGIERDVFGPRIPFLRQVGKIGKLLALLAFELPIDQRSLAGKLARFLDVIVVFQPRIGIEPRMHPGEVVALAIVLDRQLPVGLHVELEG